MQSQLCPLTAAPTSSPQPGRSPLRSAEGCTKANGVFEMDTVSTRACPQLSPASGSLAGLSPLLSPPPRCSCRWRPSLRPRRWLMRGTLVGKDSTAVLRPNPSASPVSVRGAAAERGAGVGSPSPARRGSGAGGRAGHRQGRERRLPQLRPGVGFWVTEQRRDAGPLWQRCDAPCVYPSPPPSPVRRLAGRRRSPPGVPRAAPVPVAGAGPRQAAGRPARRQR